MFIKSVIYERRIFEDIPTSVFPKRKETRNRINYCLDSENGKIYLFLAKNQKNNFIQKFKEEIYKRKSCSSNILKYFRNDFFSDKHNNNDRERSKVVNTGNPEIMDYLLTGRDIYLNRSESFYDPRIYNYVQARLDYWCWPVSLEYEGKYYTVKKKWS